MFHYNIVMYLALVSGGISMIVSVASSYPEYSASSPLLSVYVPLEKPIVVTSVSEFS